ncbi:hypothetical protein AB2N08_17970 [Massilia aurea]|uniref:hypothetical protein n=1 Tax=Massilia aurea TaxID=373040 RepID=UPI0034637B6B
MPRLRILPALCLASALGACGGQYNIDPALSLATTTMAAPAPTATTPVTAPVAVAPSLATASMPAPDCAPEGCASLRIIDGNAEAWRIDAARRSERDAGQPLT